MKLDKALYLQFLLFSIIVFVVHLLIVSIFQLEAKFEKTTYSFTEMFAFFSITSLVLLTIHNFISYKNKALLGYVFLITLTVKVVLSYIFIASELNVIGVANTFEKTYFFCLFLVYLFVDVYLTARLLNKST